MAAVSPAVETAGYRNQVRLRGLDPNPRRRVLLELARDFSRQGDVLSTRADYLGHAF